MKKHFYRGYVLYTHRNQAGKRCYLIAPQGGNPVNISKTFMSAKRLIDTWIDSTVCVCGQIRAPHNHLCKTCAMHRPFTHVRVI